MLPNSSLTSATRCFAFYNCSKARIDELMSLQLRTLDYPTRRKYFDEVQKIMSDETPFIYLVTANAYVGLKDRWQNIKIPPLGSLVWNLDELWTVFTP